MTFYLQSCQNCGFNISPYRELTKAISNYPTPKNYLLRAKWFYESGRHTILENNIDEDIEFPNHGYLSAIDDLRKAISSKSKDSFDKEAIKDAKAYLDRIQKEFNQ
ncbi:MAG: hypothetical protein CL735_01510 [Chloroflexi bacterium]|nr:hypothetical protein [Chloroflexota bacterium]